MWDGVDSSAVADYIDSLDIIGPPHAVFDRKNIAKYLRKEHPDEEVLVVHAGSSLNRLNQAPNKRPEYDPDWEFGAKYIARSQGFIESISGRRERAT